jgi:MFS transporter, DHA1 family, tetracycline resistance protein
MRKSPLFVLFITIFIDMLGFGIIIPILPIFTKELGAADYQIGLIAMIYPIMNFFFAPLWGTLSDRYGRRPIILISVFITGLAYLVFAQVNGLIILFFSRMLSGIGSANISVAQAYISDVTSLKERTKSLGFLGAAFGIGFIIGPTIGGYLKSISAPGQVDWVGYVAAGMSFINLIMAYFMLPESLKEKQSNAKFNFKVVTGIVIELRKPSIRELLLINFIFIAAFMLMQMACSLMWKEIDGLSDQQIGYVFAFIGLATAIIQGTLVGRMVKWLGEQRLITYGIFFMITGLVLLPLVGKSYFIPFELFGLTLVALANGCLTPGITSLLSKYANPREVGQVLGVNQSFGSLARAAGMGFSGFLYGMNFHVPFFAGAMMMGICFILVNNFSKIPSPTIDPELKN